MKYFYGLLEVHQIYIHSIWVNLEVSYEGR